MKADIFSALRADFPFSSVTPVLSVNFKEFIPEPVSLDAFKAIINDWEAAFLFLKYCNLFFVFISMVLSACLLLKKISLIKLS